MGYKFLVSDGLAEEGLALLRANGEVTANPKISLEELMITIPDYDVLIVRSRTKVTEALIEAGKRLKVIGRAGVGVDNINVEAAISRGIIVLNSPLAATTAVAEHTLALMLAVARKIPAADTSLKLGKWHKSQFMGIELAGKTLGLLGLGRIGESVAQLAAAFGMTVLAYDPYLTEDQIIQRNALPSTLESVLRQSDFISLHMPLTPETSGMLGTNQFSLMKRGVRLVCTARGGVIVETALWEALDNGTVAGAALDVFAIEPPPPNGIASHPLVIATPHISAQTVEAQLRAGVGIAEEVLTVLEGKEPRWRVTSVD